METNDLIPSLDEYRNAVMVEHVDGFHCDTKERAIWAARNLRGVRLKMSLNTELAAQEIAKITAWVDAVNARLQTDAEHMENFLREYAEIQRAADPKFKSERLPDATIKFRKLQPDYERDEKVILEFIRQNSLPYIQNIEKLQWAELKKKLTFSSENAILTESGEVVPGITVVARGEAFTVDTVSDRELEDK